MAQQSGLRVTTVPQEPVFAPDATVFDAVAEGLGQVRARCASAGDETMTAAGGDAQ